jgi:hypothetical protein
MGVSDDELELVFRQFEERVEYRLGVLVYATAGTRAENDSDSLHRGWKINGSPATGI